MDLFANSQERDPISPFVQLLWERGSLYETEIIENLALPFLNLRSESGDEREKSTHEAIHRREPLIYGGRIASGDLLGDPDLLRLEGDGYVAGDIKSGAGEEHSSDGTKVKKHYGVQVALYTDILEQRGFAGSRRPFIWDINGSEVRYDLDIPIGKRDPTTLWDVYEEKLALARKIMYGNGNTVAAFGSKCKLCHWRSACTKDLEAIDDLTLLPDLGRARRDALFGQIPTVTSLEKIKIEAVLAGGKSPFSGVGADTLRTLHERAKLAKKPGAKPYRKGPISLPTTTTELFFDIEVDPMRDICYLHGFVERHNSDASTESYVSFFTNDVSDVEEERIFLEAIDYINSKQPCVLYFYSKYERTWYRKLQGRYPSVCTAAHIETLFNPSQSVDLYEVVRKLTEWPTRDFSIKTLARFLGFNWRDTDPSGAASIEWFHRWAANSDPEIKQRILDYNEDDCIATRVVLDGVHALALKDQT